MLRVIDPICGLPITPWLMRRDIDFLTHDIDGIKRRALLRPEVRDWRDRMIRRRTELEVWLLRCGE